MGRPVISYIQRSSWPSPEIILSGRRSNDNMGKFVAENYKATYK